MHLDLFFLHLRLKKKKPRLIATLFLLLYRLNNLGNLIFFSDIYLSHWDSVKSSKWYMRVNWLVAAGRYGVVKESIEVLYWNGLPLGIPERMGFTSISMAFILFFWNAFWIGNIFNNWKGYFYTDKPFFC